MRRPRRLIRRTIPALDQRAHGKRIRVPSAPSTLERAPRQPRERQAVLAGAERFRAFRLLGIHPVDSYMTAELASMLRACQVLDPDAADMVDEVWNDLVPAGGLLRLKKMYYTEIAHIPCPDPDAARAYLLEIVARETNWMDERVQYLQERAELDEELAKPAAGFDDSREGELLRRYEASSQKHFHRCLDELYKWRAEKRRRIENKEFGRYYLPSPRWFEEVTRRNHMFDIETGAEFDLEDDVEDFAAVARGASEMIVIKWRNGI